MKNRLEKKMKTERSLFVCFLEKKKKLKTVKLRDHERICCIVVQKYMFTHRCVPHTCTHIHAYILI